MALEKGSKPAKGATEKIDDQVGQGKVAKSAGRIRRLNEKKGVANARKTHVAQKHRARNSCCLNGTIGAALQVNN